MRNILLAWRPIMLISLVACLAGCGGHGGNSAPSGIVRTYYVAAEETDWSYAPSNRNMLYDRPFSAEENVFVQQGPDRIGHVYIKARYREYTDGTFTTPKPIPPEWQHLGLFGPVIRGAVGDTLQVVFRNNTRFPVSMHPHGVLYHKDSEGAPSADGTSGADLADDAVATGGQHIYTWQVPERAGPGPNDPSSVLWLYHSHTNDVGDPEAGLNGPIIITARGKAKPDGTPTDVDREFVVLFRVYNENLSTYLPANIQKFCGNPASVNPDDPDFQESNMMHSINGYVFANQPPMTMKRGQRVRWYLAALGNEVDLHTAHWHGNTVLERGARTDVISLLPAEMKQCDMVPDSPGKWMFHCHVEDHMMAGMNTFYTVTP